MWQSEIVIIKWDRQQLSKMLIQSVTEVFYKVLQVLQGVTEVYYNVVLSLTDCYYKVCQCIASGITTVFTKWDVTPIFTCTCYISYHILHLSVLNVLWKFMAFLQNLLSLNHLKMQYENSFKCLISLSQFLGERISHFEICLNEKYLSMFWLLVGIILGLFLHYSVILRVRCLHLVVLRCRCSIAGPGFGQNQLMERGILVFNFSGNTYKNYQNI